MLIINGLYVLSGSYSQRLIKSLRGPLVKRGVNLLVFSSDLKVNTVTGTLSFLLRISINQLWGHLRDAYVCVLRGVGVSNAVCVCTLVSALWGRDV